MERIITDCYPSAGIGRNPGVRSFFVYENTLIVIINMTYSYHVEHAPGGH